MSAKKSDGVTTQGHTPQPASATPASGKTYAASPKSTYETPEERAVKQIYIVRQSNIASAINLLSVGAKSAPPVDAVLEVAKQLEAHVFGSTKEEVKPDMTFGDLDTMDDVPL